ncbi:hypothetical protein OPQ81_008301 [Rhizoctonia solani]|nr:hypothetical protein OPQ81_008301 [Rhizoctonia solani]
MWGGQPLPFTNGNARIIRASLHPRQIGIKCMFRKTDEQEYQHQRAALERELAVWCRLDNPRILPLSGTIMLSNDLNPNIYISPSAVFDYYEHGDITMFIRSSHRPDGKHRLRLLCEVAGGLSYLHDEGIIHGDIKSANVLIDSSKAARICDFGSAYIPQCSNCIAGTPSRFDSLRTELYLSPELWMDWEEDLPSPTTQASDVQTGIPPYKPENGRNWTHSLTKRQRGELPAQREAFSTNGPISTATGEIAFECWILEAQDRPSAQDVFEMLNEACHLFQAHL